MESSPRSMKIVASSVSVIALLASADALGQHCFWSHFDREVPYSNSGIWSPNSYRSVMNALSVAQIAGGLWEGADSRFGRTEWQGMDSQLIAAVASDLGKEAFKRRRPADGNDPCLWFQGGSNYSFPSGEAASAAALVTPYILEYGRDYPAAYALLAVPLYTGIGRIKNRAHWQSDVVAGWVVGGISGWYSSGRETPILVSILPRGFTVGFRKSF